jgi:hypothetical protein
MLCLVTLAGCLSAEGAESVASVRRIYVDRLTGESSVQIRDMIINALEKTKLFVITENPDRSDATLRGSAEDLIYTDTFQSSESISARAGVGTTRSVRIPSANVGVGQNESTRIEERKHEAIAAVRLVNRDGDVIWSTTQESSGAKFRGASADVADKVVKQLLSDIDLARSGNRTTAKQPGS